MHRCSATIWSSTADERRAGRLAPPGGGGGLVGATAAGANGGEVLGLRTLAVHAQMPVEQLRQMIYAYPTFHRGVEDAVRRIYSV